MKRNNIYYNRRLLVQAIFFYVVLFSISIVSCKKLVAVDPPIDSITAEDVYGSDVTAASVLTGIYIQMADDNSFAGQSSITLSTGLSGDELVPVTDPNNWLTKLYTNNITNEVVPFWADIYTYIFKVNDAIEGITKSSKISPAAKQQLLGEAKFLRGFYYFYLANLYGAVPLLTTTNFRTNATAARSDTSKIYDQIVQDLKEAKELLTNEYKSYNGVTTVTTGRLRPNRVAVKALLARVYLYRKQWALAESEAGEVIADNNYQLENLDSVFLVQSREAIWQVQYTRRASFFNVLDGMVFVLASVNGSEGPDAGAGRPVYLSNNVYNSFEPYDLRKKLWTDTAVVGTVVYPYAFKYKQFILTNDPTRSENLTVFRLGEQYLIRAEARAMQNNIDGAQEDLDTIRHRAGLDNTTADTQENLRTAILHERQVELFTELGNRWFDLKRMEKIDEVMEDVAPQKGATWAPYKALYPIPVSDIQKDPSLKGHQNPGYPEL